MRDELKLLEFTNTKQNDGDFVYFNGTNIYKPFSEGQDENFIVHKNRITVGIDGPRGPQVFFSAEVQEVLKVPSTQFIRVITTDGHLVVFSRSKSCGCGSRLRSWNPYGNIVSA
jgi:hypothetical protein